MLHNTVWQEIITALAAENRLLCNQINSSTRKAVPVNSKATCTKQAIVKLTRKLTVSRVTNKIIFLEEVSHAVNATHKLNV